MRILLFDVQEIPLGDRFFPVRGITSAQLELRMVTNLISVVDDDTSVRKTTILPIESSGLRTAGFESAELFLKSGPFCDELLLRPFVPP